MSFEEISEVMEVTIQSARNLLTRSFGENKKRIPSIVPFIGIYPLYCLK